MNGLPSLLALLFHQTLYDHRIFWRSVGPAFFVLVFPLIMLVVFTAIFGNESIPTLGVTTAQFYAPSLAVYGAVNAAYVNLSASTVTRREQGILKRIRGTPMPPWVYLAGRLLFTATIAFLATAVMIGIGIGAYGVRLFAHTLPAAILVLLVGVACWAALGLLLSTVLRDGAGAPAVASATLLPLAFISDVFIPPSVPLPRWAEFIADWFPLRHFTHALGDAFNPSLTGTGFAWSGGPGEYAMLHHLAVMAAWGAIAAALAARRFRWEPNPDAVA
jgi:ABC-2 type transport system permease protein